MGGGIDLMVMGSQRGRKNPIGFSMENIRRIRVGQTGSASEIIGDNSKNC